MPPESAPSLLDRRLVIVTGKGGTGKTTVAASLALAAARAGLRVLVAEVGRDEQLPGLLDPGSAPAGYAGREVAPGVRAMRIDPFEALGEYLGLQLKVTALVDLVLANASFRQLMSATPGWRELITLGKVWHLERMRKEDGRPLYDLIVVDAPATGHGVTFLDAPRVVVSAVRAGPLRRQSLEVERLLEDPARCVVLPVALPEELPTRETAELIDRVRALGVAVDRVVVNAMPAPPFPEAVPDLDERLATVPEKTLAPGRVELLRSCSHHLIGRYHMNRRYADQLASSTGLPSVWLPLVAAGIRKGSDLEPVAQALLAPDGDERAGAR